MTAPPFGAILAPRPASRSTLRITVADLTTSFSIVLYILWNLIIIGGLGIGARLAYRAVRALERRRADSGSVNQLRARTEQLEEALDASQREVARLEAEQEFMNRLLSDRAEAK